MTDLDRNTVETARQTAPQQPPSPGTQPDGSNGALRREQLRINIFDHRQVCATGRKDKEAVNRGDASSLGSPIAMRDFRRFWTLGEARPLPARSSRRVRVLG
jgi:hypothetical protein